MKETGNNREQKIAKLKPIVLDSLKKTFANNEEVANSLEKIFEPLSKKPSFVPDRATLELGLRFLHEADRDIKSCKLLNSKSFYPHAVYHLQQASEKLVKAYVLQEGYFNATELHKQLMNHQTPLILINATLIKTGFKAIAMLTKDPTLQKIIDVERTIKDENKRIEIARISQSEIRQLQGQIEEYRQMGYSFEKLFNQGLSDSGLGVGPISIPAALSGLGTMLILALITFPHEAYTRYPDGKMKPDDYTTKLGIVSEMPRLTLLLEKEISNLEIMCTPK